MSTLSATNLKNASSGSNNIVLATDGSTTITTLNGTTITGTSVRGVITSGTAVASTSGTAIDFTSIPSWVKRVTVLFNGVSANGSSNLLIQIGSGSFATSGYVSSCSGGGATATTTAGLQLSNTVSSAAVAHGDVVISLLTGNSYVSRGVLGIQTGVNTGTSSFSGGGVTLSGTLDRIRITTVNGTDTFDAGTINILYEG